VTIDALTTEGLMQKKAVSETYSALDVKEPQWQVVSVDDKNLVPETVMRVPPDTLPDDGMMLFT
jgi:hypothetical protein